MKKIYLILFLLLAVAADSQASFFGMPSKSPIVLFSATAIGGNTTAGEDILQTYSMPANTFNRNGQLLRIVVIGSTANNANAKNLKLYFGSAVLTSGALTINNGASFKIDAFVFRTGASTQLLDLAGFWMQNTTIVGSGMANATQTDTAAIVIKTTGTATTAADITNVVMTVELINP